MTLRASPEHGSRDTELQRAISHLRQGRLDSAQAIVASVLALLPDDPGALGLMAALALRERRVPDAARFAERAVEVAPNDPAHVYTLGGVRRAQGRIEEAIAAYRRAATLEPGLGIAHFALGLALADAGRLDDAVSAFQDATRLDPDLADGHLHHASALQTVGRLEEAVSAYERCLALAPRTVAAVANLGALLGMLERFVEAEAVSRRALALDPDLPQAHIGLGKALAGQGFHNAAAECFERAMAGGIMDAALLNDYGFALYSAGLGERAIAAYGQALVAPEASPSVHSNLLLTLNYEQTDPLRIIAHHLDYDRKTAVATVSAAPGLIQRRGERIRLGYVSPDFRGHSVAYFIEPVLERHDRRRFEVVCYYTHTARDDVTARIRSRADEWVDATNLGNDALAERIRADRIDLLIDLAGHTGGNRLQVFAQRAAPVQATFLGYPTTSGLAAMDYRVTDAYVDPPDDAAPYPELPLRLPASYFCYRPPRSAPAVGALPALTAPNVTFGSFNNLVKVSPATLDLWSSVLGAVDGSRLILKNRSLVDPVTRMRIAERFVARGIEPGRILMTGWEGATESHLGWYNRVDIALDTFPYNGATTTCEALWMGVPVVSLAGATHAARMGRSILGAVGLSHWVAGDPAGFCSRCVEAASNLSELAATRAGLRAQVAASALMAEAPYVAALEQMFEAAFAGGPRQAQGKRTGVPGAEFADRHLGRIGSDAAR